MNESLQRILFLDGKYISKQLVYHIQDCIIYLVFFKYMYMYNLQKIPPTFNKIEIMHKHVYTFVYQDILISLKKVKQKWLQWQVIWAVFCQFSIKIDFSLDFAPWYKWHYAYRGNLTWHHFYNFHQTGNSHTVFLKVSD